MWVTLSRSTRWFRRYHFFDPPTALPYYGADGQRSARNRMGVEQFPFEVRRSRVTPFCRSCADQDLKTYGVTIARRELLLPGVTFCVSCQTPLEWPCVECERTVSSRGSLKFPGPCRAAGHKRHYLSDDLKGNPDELLLLSRELIGTLNYNRGIRGGQESILNAYKAIGCRRGDQVSRPKVASVLQDHFSTSLLTSVGLLTKSDDGSLDHSVPRARGNAKGLYWHFAPASYSSSATSPKSAPHQTPDRWSGLHTGAS